MATVQYRKLLFSSNAASLVDLNSADLGQVEKVQSSRRAETDGSGAVFSCHSTCLPSVVSCKVLWVVTVARRWQGVWKTPSAPNESQISPTYAPSQD
jgi:hypothetical protein